MQSNRTKGGHSKAAIRCSYCQRSFARTEHLARHERSHRNEKPYSCKYCNSTFARKDVIKRHHQRYHPDVSETGVDNISARNASTELSAPIAEEPQPQPTADAQPQPTADAQPVPLVSATTASLYMDGYKDDFGVLAYPQQAPFDPTNVLDSFLDDMDYNFRTDDMLLGASDLLGLRFNDGSNPILDTIQSPQSSLSTEISVQIWRGSCEISSVKRSELDQTVQAALSQDGELYNFKFPSCLTIERLLTTCFEVFLTYMPCIHTPTWRAESAHSTLLISMAALSACHGGEQEISHTLYRAGRRLITRHLDSSRAWNMEHSEWLVQSMLILMCYGTSCGQWDEFNDALSWASLLANGVRRQKIPDISLSTTGACDETEAGQDLYTAWRQWVEYESAIRTKCAGFLILNNLSICYNVSPPLLSHEMSDIPLPCRESEWTSSTPETWMQNRERANPKIIRFDNALHCLLSPGSTAIQTSSFGAYVMLHTIIQRMYKYQQDMWLMDAFPSYFQTFFTALQKWQVSWENDPECSVSPRGLQGAVSSNAGALLRLAYMRLHTDFSPVRSAMVSLDRDKISQSMKDLSIKIDRSHTTLKTASHALQSLRTRIKMGMTSKSSRRVTPHGLQIHLVSIECCLFASAWTREISSHPEHERTADENECVQLVGEILDDVEIGQANSQKPYSTQLIYAWAAVLESCAVWGIQSILADALINYADSLPA